MSRIDWPLLGTVLALMAGGLMLGAVLSVAGQFAAWWWRW